MNDFSINAIAKKMNVSPSVVSRVLRHCGGVDSETRHRILAEAEKLREPNYGSCTVYGIFPDVPRYFWVPIRRGVAEVLQAEGIPFKANVCTKVVDEAAILQYLNEAERMNAQAIILAVRSTPAIRERLEAFAEDRIVLFISEYCELKNAFYCGSNAFSDGYRMGQYYAEHYADRTLILIELPNDANSESRIEGFSRAVQDNDASLLEKSVRITTERKHLSNFKLISSKLAPLLVNAADKNDRLAIYVPAGIPQFPLAISKAELTGRTILLCQDCSATEKNIGELVSCNQNGVEQGKTAARLVSEYIKTGFFPSEKKTFVPSEIRILTKPEPIK